jgi:hypothetical protein
MFLTYFIFTSPFNFWYKKTASPKVKRFDEMYLIFVLIISSTNWNLTLRQTESLCSVHDYITIINVPIPIRIHPINDLIVNSSCKNTNAKIKVITTLNLSIGTTFEASPNCKAL